MPSMAHLIYQTPPPAPYYLAPVDGLQHSYLLSFKTGREESISTAPIALKGLTKLVQLHPGKSPFNLLKVN
jgi:hypothetical protein